MEHTSTYTTTYTTCNTTMERAQQDALSLRDEPSLVSRFIAYLDVSEASSRTYLKAITSFLSWMREHGIQSPDRDDVRLWRDAMRITCKARTVALYVTTVRRFFAWTEAEGLYPDVAKGLKAGVHIDSEHFAKDNLTAPELTDVLTSVDRSSLQGKRDYAMLLVMATCGLRTVEVMRADVRDYERRGAERRLYVQGKGQSEKLRYVKIVPEVAEALEAYLTARGKASPEEPLFSSTSNRNLAGRMTTTSISRIVKTAMRTAGYDSDRLTAHSLRHTAVTLALEGGETLQEVQQFARHKAITTTMVYNHAISWERNSCSESVARQIFTASSAGFPC